MQQYRVHVRQSRLVSVMSNECKTLQTCIVFICALLKILGRIANNILMLSVIVCVCSVNRNCLKVHYGGGNPEEGRKPATL